MIRSVDNRKWMGRRRRLTRKSDFRRKGEVRRLGEKWPAKVNQDKTAEEKRIRRTSRWISVMARAPRPASVATEWAARYRLRLKPLLPSRWRAWLSPPLVPAIHPR